MLYRTSPLVRKEYASSHTLDPVTVDGASVALDADAFNNLNEVVKELFGSGNVKIPGNLIVDGNIILQHNGQNVIRMRPEKNAHHFRKLTLSNKLVGFSEMIYLFSFFFWGRRFFPKHRYHLKADPQVVAKRQGRSGS